MALKFKVYDPDGTFQKTVLRRGITWAANNAPYRPDSPFLYLTRRPGAGSYYLTYGSQSNFERSPVPQYPPAEALALLGIGAGTTVSTKPQQEQTPMITITHPTIVDGTNANELSDEQLLNKIVTAEADLAKLNNIVAKSAFIEARKAEITKGIVGLVKILDERTPKSA